MACLTGLSWVSDAWGGASSSPPNTRVYSSVNVAAAIRSHGCYGHPPHAFGEPEPWHCLSVPVHVNVPHFMLPPPGVACLAQLVHSQRHPPHACRGGVPKAPGSPCARAAPRWAASHGQCFCPSSVTSAIAASSCLPLKLIGGEALYGLLGVCGINQLPH